MIINGGSRSNGRFFSKHLMNAEKNERVKVVEVRGLSSRDIAGCFREMKAVSSGTRTKNFFYHANINIPDHEKMTPEQWEQAVDALEKKLGLEGQARFVIEHEKEGRTHQHIIWSRIDVENMRAIRMSNDYAKHQATARQLEKEFNLERGISVLGEDVQKPRPERRPEQWEVFRGKESGVDPKRMKEEITEIWRTAQNGKEFAEKLQGLGYVLSRGDRRNFCIVDRAGHVHSLARRIKDAKAAGVADRLSDIDPKTLPDIEQAKEYQKQQEENREKEIGQDEERRRETIKKDEENRQQSIKDDEARKQQSEKEQEQKFKEQADRQVEQAKEMEQAQRFLDDYKAELSRRAEEAGRERDREAKAREGDIGNAGYRYGQALGQHYDIRDPYGSLARSAMAEYGMFMQERQNLDRQIAKADDPKTRQALELRKRIEAAEYMEITSNRIAAQSEIIVGRRDTQEAVRQRDRAGAFHQEAQNLRKEYRELYASRADGVGPGKPEPPREEKESNVAPVQEKNQDTAPALMVEDRIPGKPRGNKRTLMDYVNTLPEKPEPKKFTKEQLFNDRAAEREHYKQLRQEQNRVTALDGISRDMKAKKNLNAEHISHLSREDLKNIKAQGDQYLKTLVQQHEKYRQLEKGRER